MQQRVLDNRDEFDILQVVPSVCVIGPRELKTYYISYTCKRWIRCVGIKSKFRTMSFLKSRLLPLPLSFLCSPGGGGEVLVEYYMYMLDSHSSSSISFTTRQRRRPSPRYFYDVFCTLYRFFPPRPKVFSQPTPFFFVTSKRFNVLFYIYYYYCYYYYIFIINIIFVYSAPSSISLFFPLQD